MKEYIESKQGYEIKKAIELKVFEKRSEIDASCAIVRVFNHEFFFCLIKYNIFFSLFFVQISLF